MRGDKMPKRLGPLDGLTDAQISALANEINVRKRSNRTKRFKLGFSKLMMACVMLMFFAGVALGVHAVLELGEPVSTVLNYIMTMALPVGLAYLVKAFGENIAKIILGGRSGVDRFEREGPF